MQKKILYIFAAFACALFLFGKDACSCLEERPKKFQFFPFKGPFQNLRDAISNAIRDGHFRQDDFEKLDFSTPGDPAYGDNAEFEVFNPNGPFGAQRIPDWTKVPDMFTKDSKTVYILRRRLQNPGDGAAISDALIAVITNLNKEACQKYKYPDKPDIKLSTPLDLAPINLVPDSDLYRALGEAYNQCVVDANGVWYYLEWITSRDKSAESDPWNLNYGTKCTLSEAKAEKYCPGVYVGWQAKPTIVKDPGELNVAHFKRRPPPTAEYYVWKTFWATIKIALFVMVGTWVLCLFHTVGRTIGRLLPHRISSHENIIAWLSMALPLIIVFSRTRYLPYQLAGALFLYWLLCAAIVHLLYRRNKMSLMMNGLVATFSVVLFLLAGILGGGTCNNDFWSIW